MPIRAVIFDLMDVLLLVEDRAVWNTWEASVGVPEGALARAMFQSPLFREAIVGHVPEEELWRAVARSLGVADAPARLASVFYSAFRVNSGLVECIRSLRPRLQVAILTNTPSNMRAVLTQRFHLDREVDAIIISAEEGLHKPQPAFYQRALARLGVPPQEALYVDDEPRFVEGAQALGMWIVQFKDNAQSLPEIEHLLAQQT